jgi:hypothetical protein
VHFQCTFGIKERRQVKRVWKIREEHRNSGFLKKKEIMKIIAPFAFLIKK